VEGDLLSSSSSRARSIGSSSGIQSSFAGKCLIGCKGGPLVRSNIYGRIQRRMLNSLLWRAPRRSFYENESLATRA
jgi:hypothetical protein